MELPRHKFECEKDAAKKKIKFKPIVDQSGGYMYQVAQITSNYLKPLYKNECTLQGVQSILEPLSTLNSLEEGKMFLGMTSC